MTSALCPISSESGRVKHYTMKVIGCYSVFMEWDFARKNRAESKSHWCAGARGGITLILQHIDIIALFQFYFLRYRRLYRHPATRRPGKPMLLPSPWTIIRAISKSTPSGFFAVRPMACLLNSSVCQHNCYSSSSLSASGIASRRRRSSSIVLAASASRCCLCPLKLSHYRCASGRVRHGSEAVFGR